MVVQTLANTSVFISTSRRKSIRNVYQDTIANEKCHYSSRQKVKLKLNSISLPTVVLSATKSPHRKLWLVRIPYKPELRCMPSVQDEPKGHFNNNICISTAKAFKQRFCCRALMTSLSSFVKRIADVHKNQ